MTSTDKPTSQISSPAQGEANSTAQDSNNKDVDNKLVCKPFVSEPESVKQQAILLGMQGVPVVEICKQFGITRNIYEAWRDELFANSVVAGPKSNRNITYQY